MSARSTVLVTGATGKQGGAVARALLGRGYAVRAFVRDPDRPEARALAALGARPVVGDFADPRSLRAAAEGVHGVYRAQPGDLLDDPGTNARRGRAIVDAAAAAGVAHLVYSTAGAVGHDSGVGHFEGMAEVEAHIHAVGLPATVLRPTFFMENWTYMLSEPGDGGRVGSLALDADTRLQMVSVGDIGRIAADAFDRPDEFAGAALDLAADELTPRQIAEVFTAVDGVPTRIARTPAGDLRKDSEQLAAFFSWLNTTGFRADVAALRRRWPGLLTLEAWLRGKGQCGDHE